MAVIRVSKKRDFMDAASMNAKPSSHMVVTDNATYVYLVPVVTSHHRHYIVYEGDEEEIREIVEKLKREGYSVIEGELDMKNC